MPGIETPFARWVGPLTEPSPALARTAASSITPELGWGPPGYRDVERCTIAKLPTTPMTSTALTRVSGARTPTASRVAAGRFPGACRALPALLVALGFVVLAWSLIVALSKPLQGDELTSLFRFSSGGPSGIWGAYIPNDHMLFEFLTWVLVQVTGDRSEAINRFWSVLPAIGAAAMLTSWAWRRQGRWVAALFIALLAAAPLFVDTSIEARGYGLAFAGSAMMFVGCDWTARRGGRSAIALFSAGGLVGVLSLPVFVLPFAFFAALLFIANIERRDLVIGCTVVAVLSVIFYAPVLGDLFSSAGQHDGQQLGLLGFIVGPIRYLLQPSAQALTHQVSNTSADAFLPQIWGNTAPASAVGADVIAGCAIVLGTVVLIRRREPFLATALLGPAIFSYLVIEVVRLYVISRFVSFVLPELLLLIAIGLVGVATDVTRRRSLTPLVAVAGGVICLLVLEKGYGLARANADRTNPPIVSNYPGGFAGYIAPSEITPVTPDLLVTFACQTGGHLAYLDFDPSSDSAAVKACIASRAAWGMAHLRIPTTRGTVPATVWNFG